MVEVREYIIRKVFAVVEIGKILDKLIQRHLLSYVLQTHAVTESMYSTPNS